MRLWSIHPMYLDTKGLVALWREGLLAQKVLLGQTKGYKKHPQLDRFKSLRDPVGAIASYLINVAEEADKRGYRFNNDKILSKGIKTNIPVTDGQVEYEFSHLLSKLRVRDPALYEKLRFVKDIQVHPSFRKVNGEVENWEKV